MLEEILFMYRYVNCKSRSDISWRQILQNCEISGNQDRSEKLNMTGAMYLRSDRLRTDWFIEISCQRPVVQHGKNILTQIIELTK